ncbi:branched-chain amino acid ABC transporter permease [Variovorax arabinosiphilus]|uniref:branched-chain amino acid ABC transporter permease n=1 Tax=Variovorax arabinosiphilus TaxID=3053498 RepID=UPI0025753AAC|nr:MULTISPECIES: branched-chain amino acid ABC transporter permease [unclassified Variovorax]MDM0122962.1 branched-chain amino acid ABC transporter permease [Variovorax sp. J2L1-78]MDM0132042.1 branched-chain amino acid ABC transporter permease [Variovorax sp. J2L1-63]MDM0235725.1 branched-chain amino acid ABC transporter permease [Variovorax sp. J2R1-6]
MNRFAKSWVSAAVSLAVGVALLFGLPGVLDDYTLIEVTIYAVMSILGVSLAFIWGFGGILCFGQTAFFGLGAYTYAIGVMNTGDSTVPFLLAIVVPALFAALLGYVIFYGRLSDVYMGVITLTVTLILFNLINSTAGPEWRIGSAPLGGFNGIPAIPTLNWPGQQDEVLSPKDLFYVTFACLLLVYLGLRVLIASKVGRVIVAAKENEQRVLLLGYDARVYKLLCFTLGGAIAGLAGCLFANWGAFTSPTIFGLAQSAQIIIWVIVGGLGTLIGPIVGCVLIQWLTSQIGTQQVFNSNLVLGGILVVFVLLVPRGIVPTLGNLIDMAWRMLRPSARTAKPEKSGIAKVEPDAVPALPLATKEQAS